MGLTVSPAIAVGGWPAQSSSIICRLMYLVQKLRGKRQTRIATPLEKCRPQLRNLFDNLKGMKNDLSLFKKAPLSCLSTRMAAEDSLRLILILVLMDGAFDDGIKHWHDPTKLRPEKGGFFSVITIGHSATFSILITVYIEKFSLRDAPTPVIQSK